MKKATNYDKMEKSESMRVEIRSRKAQKLIQETMKIADSPSTKTYAFWFFSSFFLQRCLKWSLICNGCSLISMNLLCCFLIFSVWEEGKKKKKIFFLSLSFSCWFSGLPNTTLNFFFFSLSEIKCLSFSGKVEIRTSDELWYQVLWLCLSDCVALVSTYKRRYMSISRKFWMK